MSAAAAREACHQGIENARRGVTDEWVDAALEAVADVALNHEYFTADACRGLAPEPPNPKAWGPVMQLAQKLKWIERTDRVQSTGRVSCHRSPKRVWRSLLRSLK